MERLKLKLYNTLFWFATLFKAVFMKKIKFIIPILFVFSFLFVSCPDENEAENLPNTDFYISPEKNSYSINDNLLITFSSIPNFSTFDKYTFEIYAKKYDTTQNEYVLTDKVDLRFTNLRFTIYFAIV